MTLFSLSFTARVTPHEAYTEAQVLGSKTALQICDILVFACDSRPPINASFDKV